MSRLVLAALPLAAVLFAGCGQAAPVAPTELTGGPVVDTDATVAARVQATVAAVSASATQQPAPVNPTQPPAATFTIPQPTIGASPAASSSCFITAGVGPSRLFLTVEQETAASDGTGVATQLDQVLRPLGEGKVPVSVSGTTNATPIPPGVERACSRSTQVIYSDNVVIAQAACQSIGAPLNPGPRLAAQLGSAASSASPGTAKPTQTPPQVAVIRQEQAVRDRFGTVTVRGLVQKNRRPTGL
jgi:hypothetical protein